MSAVCRRQKRRRGGPIYRLKQADEGRSGDSRVSESWAGTAPLTLDHMPPRERRGRRRITHSGTNCGVRRPGYGRRPPAAGGPRRGYADEVAPRPLGVRQCGATTTRASSSERSRQLLLRSTESARARAPDRALSACRLQWKNMPPSCSSLARAPQDAPRPLQSRKFRKLQRRRQSTGAGKAHACGARIARQEGPP